MLHEKFQCSLNSDFHSFLYVLYFYVFSKGNLHRFYFTAAGVKCQVVAVKSLPILHYKSQFLLLFSLESLGLFWCLQCSNLTFLTAC